MSQLDGAIVRARLYRLTGESSHFEMHEYENTARELVDKLLLFPIIGLVVASFSLICFCAQGGILLLHCGM